MPSGGVHSVWQSFGTPGCLRWSAPPEGREHLLQASVADLQKAFHKAKPKYYPSRQRFTLPLKPGEKKAIALAPGKKLSDYDLEDGSTLNFKDLGPQVAPCKEPRLVLECCMKSGY